MQHPQCGVGAAEKVNIFREQGGSGLILKMPAGAGVLLAGAGRVTNQLKTLVEIC